MPDIDETQLWYFGLQETAKKHKSPAVGICDFCFKKMGSHQTHSTLSRYGTVHTFCDEKCSTKYLEERTTQRKWFSLWDWGE